MANDSYDKKFQIFVSSTYKDLIEERQKLVEAILHTGNIPAGMELFTASNKDQWQIIQTWIDESDIVILLIGSRYGSIPQGEEKSYTHKEYDYAKANNKIVLRFIMSESHMYGKVSSGAYTSRDIQENINKEKFDRFKENVIGSSLCKLNIQNIDQLKSEVILSIVKETTDLDGGWVKYDTVVKNNSESLNKISEKHLKDKYIYKEQREDLNEIYNYLKNINDNPNLFPIIALDVFTDFYNKYCTKNPIKRYSVSKYEKLLNEFGKSLKDFANLAHENIYVKDGNINYGRISYKGHRYVINREHELSEKFNIEFYNLLMKTFDSYESYVSCCEENLL
ncbi:DUF4062 domain-containing protein [Staphylococcus sciuri]|uniref:DUF4062 domain-containing protein n=1 Tax=Mammaliicoccus sciuri TaxID=1296 RepID=UPI000878DD9E|nr:DUF4062 domain-containing protein [Mammaliicoccus sciuri]MBG9204769.1 DUF4062 domain-containing protein [Mammaliicoccus sciuri]